MREERGGEGGEGGMQFWEMGELRNRSGRNPTALSCY